jgi:hypothetical protein
VWVVGVGGLGEQGVDTVSSTFFDHVRSICLTYAMDTLSICLENVTRYLCLKVRQITDLALV